MQKQQDSSDSAYQPHLRLTETNSGFGVHGSVAESYRGSDPSEIISSINRDIVNLRASINELDSCHNRKSKLCEISDLKNTLNERMQAARDAIHGKIAQGTQEVVTNRLKAQLDKAIKDEKKLLEELIKNQKAASVKESSLDEVDSNPSTSKGGVGRQQEQGFAQVQSSAVEQRESEAEAIRHLENDILGLNEIHQDLNKHVHDEGEVIDKIGQHVEVASNRVTEGTKNTEKIRKLAISRRKLICVILSIVGGVAVTVLIVIIIIAVVVSGNNNSN